MGRHAQRGFTLVEILVVIAILVALAGLIFPIMRSAKVSSQVKACKGVIDTLSGALEQYASDFGDYPPTSLKKLGVRTNGINEGNEALVRCLSTGQKEGPYFEFKEDQLQNVDQDRLSGADPTGSIFGSGELFEMVDPWGHPYVYFHHTDFRGGKDVERYTLVDGDIKAQPQPSGKTGQYPGFGKFVIWSVGPDGVNENGEGDDVCSWK